ncbi:serine O-acetyltransferase [Spongiibacter sp. IMCC21906]|uniref:serine O-acetyltransferase n=1 Tax=Spongiibacter sp. IMCC21906 TaxID=1620392 RepID=UPI00062DF49B|nr:serine O-acetyltransferase [Spongiibacter sp. IMCC21906]AKH70860.1 serine O-acetyltransferase [Spongiibacter sp. IMCC21906]
MSLSVAELWSAMTTEAQQYGGNEPVLASFYHASILNHPDFPAALSFQIAGKLGCDSVPAMLVRDVFHEAMAADPGIVRAAADDICAHFDRDPACDHYGMPFLYFKGFQAVQGYRIAHWLWQQGRISMALFLQNRIATAFDVDIHPAATLGSGIMIDHATGLVIGETAVVGNNVSMLHSVTLGGCGSRRGLRHPRIGDGVLISAGAKVLGGINVGEGAKIAAGSVVLCDVGPFTTVAGVPAKQVGRETNELPALNMDQNIDEA